MEPFLGFCLTFAVGWVGFVLFKRLRFPNPALLGSMIATGTLSVCGYFPQFSTWLVSFAANALIGAMIGRQIDRTILARIKKLLRPVLVQTLGIFVLSFICGYTLYALGKETNISLTTALLSGTAGGLTEMLIFGLSTNADVSIIALVQLLRVVTFTALIPYLALLGKKTNPQDTSPATAATAIPLPAFTTKQYVLLAICAILGGVIGRVSEVPSGALLGSMLACAGLALFLNRNYKYDIRLRLYAQIGIGLVMGQRMTPDIVARLGDMVLPAVASTVIMLVGCVILALILHKTTGWNMTTCLLCAAPAGLSQITVFAEDIGVDSLTATVFHTVRILSIVALYPWIIMHVLTG